MQRVSFNLLEELTPIARIVRDENLLKAWRLLQTSDHLYYMSTKGGGSDIVHKSFNPYGSSVDAFITFIRILSDLYARYQLEISKPEFRYRLLLRKLPTRRGFTFFYEFAKPTKLTAYSLEEFYSAIKVVDLRSIRFHMERGDFERWLSQAVGDKELAKRLSEISDEHLDGEALRSRLLKVLEDRIRELKRVSYKP